MIETDRIAEANEAIDRRARQRHAAALALAEAQTPEAIAAEAERQRQNAYLAAADPNEYGPDRDYVEEGPLSDEGLITSLRRDSQVAGDLAQKLEEALQPVMDDAAVNEPAIIGIGRSVFQWILVPSEDEENPEGYQLGLQLQVDEQPPAGFVAEITPNMLEDWNRGKGLQGNRVEHKQFVAALFERAIGVGAGETGNQLIYVLEQLMVDTFGDGRNWGRPHEDDPTETAVGEDDDGPFADAPENADEVPE